MSIIPGISSKSFEFSLSRGSGLKSSTGSAAALTLSVLPLTREWIEILDLDYIIYLARCSPSHEGVD